jgi:hypothetical protein
VHSHRFAGLPGEKKSNQIRRGGDSEGASSRHPSLWKQLTHGYRKQLYE